MAAEGHRVQFASSTAKELRVFAQRLITTVLKAPLHKSLSCTEVGQFTHKR